MIKAAIVGFGNIGHAVYEALGTCGDIHLAGIVSGSLAPGSLKNVPVVREIHNLDRVDVAILCAPSRLVPDMAAGLLKQGICTVDSYDIHSSVYEVRQRLDGVFHRDPSCRLGV